MAREMVEKAAMNVNGGDYDNVEFNWVKSKICPLKMVQST
jgi:hypothetical protein